MCENFLGLDAKKIHEKNKKIKKEKKRKTKKMEENKD